MGKRTVDVVLTYTTTTATFSYNRAVWFGILRYVWSLSARIAGLEDGSFATGSSIDAHCLGGSMRPYNQVPLEEVRPYWAGQRGTRWAHAVEAFLADYGEVCTGMVDCLKPGGIAVIIVGQRSTGGYRLKL